MHCIPKYRTALLVWTSTTKNPYSSVSLNQCLLFLLLPQVRVAPALCPPPRHRSFSWGCCRIRQAPPTSPAAIAVDCDTRFPPRFRPVADPLTPCISCSRPVLLPSAPSDDCPPRVGVTDVCGDACVMRTFWWPCLICFPPRCPSLRLLYDAMFYLCDFVCCKMSLSTLKSVKQKDTDMCCLGLCVCCVCECCKHWESIFCETSREK